MEPITEKQAWLYLAEVFDNPDNLERHRLRFHYYLVGVDWRDYEPSGLCDCIRLLASRYTKHRISSIVCKTMLDKVSRFAPEHMEGEYAWTVLDLSGFRERAAFCRRMAEGE